MRAEKPAASHVNQVQIVGRVSAAAEPRELPSGDTMLQLRVIVDREPSAARPGAKVDTLDCAVWSPGLCRRVSTWRAGDLVEVSGAIRRRFFRAGGSVASRVEIEVGRARLVSRARRPEPG